MLSTLFIRDIVLIKQLELDFKTGLSVLSGETGAGKSILLDALSLALGARGDGNLVRMDCNQGQVSATFTLPKNHNVLEQLAQNDLPIAEELILKRIQSREGPTKAYVNDTPVSVALLSQIGSSLVEIHGQHDERALIDPTGHRDLTDAFGELHNELSQTRQAHSLWRSAVKELKATKAKVAEIAKDAEYLRSSVDELTLLSPQEGEEENLATKRKTMMQSESLVSDISDALSNLNNAKGPSPAIAKVARQLETKSAEVLKPSLEALYQAQESLSKAGDELQKSLNLCAFEPHELEASEERLFALRAASRKFRVPVENLAEHHEKLKKNLEALNSGEENLVALEEDEKKKYDKLRKSADKLSKARTAAGEKLQKRVMSQLPSLKLQNAEFYLHHTTSPEDIGSHGYDSIEFYVRTNASTRSGPMMKVASGGELSRFLLALKVVLADCSSAGCLVFDEIDTGAGGAVADAIGLRLKQLSSSVQVLSITHAPQVAARADEHFLISKAGKSKMEETCVENLSAQSRKEEIARMISGAEISDAARKAAMQLLSESMSA